MLIRQISQQKIRLTIATISQKVHENEELRQVIEGDNTETNKRYKFEQVVDDILLDFVNSKLELYKKLSKQGSQSRSQTSTLSSLS